MSAVSRIQAVVVGTADGRAGEIIAADAAPSADIAADDIIVVVDDLLLVPSAVDDTAVVVEPVAAVRY